MTLDSHIKEVSVTAIDYNNLKPEDVFKWLELFGFHRYPIEYHLESQKVTDQRYAHRFNPLGKREIKGGTCPMMIVPWYDVNETMFIIRESEYDRIKKAFLEKTSAEEEEP